MLTAQETSTRVERARNGRFVRTVAAAAPKIIGAEGVSEARAPRIDPRKTPISPVWNEPVYRSMLSIMPDWVFVIAGDGLVLECQSPPESESPAVAKNFVGKRLIELLPAQLAQQARYYLEKTLRTGQSQIFTTQFLLRGKECQFQ